MNHSANLHVFILAGGLGKRMESTLPKVLHCVLNKPMLVHVIETAKLLHPSKIFIVVGKYREIIETTLNEYISLENIIFVNQHEALGTGHALQCALPELSSLPPNDQILVLSGDVPLLKLSTMKSMIKMKNSANIMTTFYKDPKGYGRIITENGKFQKIVEQKDCDEREKQIQIVNAGIYSFDVSILCKNLPKINNHNAQSEYYLTDIFEIIKNNENITIGMVQLPTHKNIELTGINTKQQLEELESKLK